MTRQEKANQATQRLQKEYPDELLTLWFEKPYELLFATRLAAQCTDARVNIVTKDLFRIYPTLESFAQADAKEVEAIIRPCGLAPTKSKDLVNAAQMILEDFAGQVPDTMEALTKLPGIGRKTANIILGDVFGKPAIPVDTHCLRITNLLGLADSKNPAIVEQQLGEVLDPEKSNNFCHRLVLHGRAVCVARNPQCKRCVLAEFCDYALSRRE